MNKIYKFLSLAVLLSLATTARAHDFEVDGIYYNITSETDLTVEVTYRGDDYYSYSNEYSKAVTIPPSVIHDEKTYSVTRIGNEAFHGCSGLTSITIPSSVSSIGYEAFYWCSGLTSVKVDEGNKVYDSREGCNAIIETATNTLVAGCKSTIIASSVTNIKNYAFCGCSGLTSITIPSSVTSIGSGAFDYCRGLTSVKVDEGNKVYDSREGCNAIIETATNTLLLGCKSTIIASSVTSIGNRAFYGCSGLTSITIPSSVTSIGNSAFEDCSGLKSITIPEGVTTIGEDTFFGCSGLTSVTIPSSVTSIGSGAFSKCSKLTSITIPEGVTTIGNSAFEGCSSLTYINIPSSVTSIAYSAFSGCNNLTCHVEGGSYASLWAHSQGLRCAEPFVKGYSHTASSIRLEFYPFAENVHVSSFTVDGMEVLSGDYSITMLGLPPNNHNSFQYVVRTDAGTFTFTEGYRTDALTLTAEQPKVISVGNVIVSAQSNLDDAEEKVGFEWRRTDWTDDFASNTGEAYLFEGTMEGYIRNLYAEKLWKYRPYYEASDGTRYYGEWVGIDPANTSYFEPTVHTYASVVVDGSTAAVKGYVQRGTDDVAEQGFAYWKTETGAKGREDARRIESIPDDATTVVARGKVMTATLTGLEAGTEYTYVAYVITDEGETFYGEEQTFRTDVATGIEETTAAPVQRAVPQGVFNLSGQRLSAPQKGLNIINGKKVLVK